MVRDVFHALFVHNQDVELCIPKLLGKHFHRFPLMFACTFNAEHRNSFNTYTIIHGNQQGEKLLKLFLPMSFFRNLDARVAV